VGPRTRIVVGMTGSSGVIYGIRLLEALGAASVETHLVASEWALKTVSIETSYRSSDVLEMADRTYRADNQAAAISSGSFHTDGMIIAPCSMKTLSAIANGYSDNLIARAADVTLKEQRKLILLVRESPLNSIHLENMLKLTRAGAVIAPPVPAFYAKLRSLDDMISHTIGRALDLVQVEHSLVRRWADGGSRKAGGALVDDLPLADDVLDSASGLSVNLSAAARDQQGPR
jgi:flavin prenyltransferase